MLVARRLVEAGVPFVRVGRAWWDSHGQNFETHQEMVPELDHVMATLIDDLKDRGLLDDVMIVTLAEFGRTPAINASLGRDHFASAWSMHASPGCGIKGGSVYGKTDAKGNTVVDERGGRGQPVRHDLRGARHQPAQELLRRQPPDPAGEPRRRGDQGAGAVTVAGAV